jgi:hypothetical protein
LIDCLLVIANDADGIRPDQDFADTMATALIRQLRELGLPLS